VRRAVHTRDPDKQDDDHGVFSRRDGGAGLDGFDRLRAFLVLLDDNVSVRLEVGEDQHLAGRPADRPPIHPVGVGSTFANSAVASVSIRFLHFSRRAVREGLACRPPRRYSVPSSFPGGGYRRLAARKGLDGVNGQPEAASAGTPLTRAIGVWQATALNITMIVGAGVFATIPLMLTELPGPYALLGWIGAGALVLVDGLIWSELGAALPGSGGSYQYLLVAYGPKKWGRLMAFLFIWQFLISGPLELGSGFAAIAQFSTDLSPGFKEYNEGSKAEWTFHEWYEKGEKQSVGMSFRPARWLAFSFGVVIIALLYRNISSLGKMTVALWLGVLGTIAWVLIEGIWHFRAATAFSYSGDAGRWPDAFMGKLGAAMILAMYSYLRLLQRLLHR
jgi:hypothetical protein